MLVFPVECLSHSHLASSVPPLPLPASWAVQHFVPCCCAAAKCARRRGLAGRRWRCPPSRDFRAVFASLFARGCMQITVTAQRKSSLTWQCTLASRTYCKGFIRRALQFEWKSGSARAETTPPNPTLPTPDHSSTHMRLGVQQQISSRSNICVVSERNPPSCQALRRPSWDPLHPRPCPAAHE